MTRRSNQDEENQPVVSAIEPTAAQAVERAKQDDKLPDPDTDSKQAEKDAK